MWIAVSSAVADHALSIPLTFVSRDKQFGELAPQSADAYFMYGKALLQYAIKQSSVLGNKAAEESTAIEESETRKELFPPITYVSNIFFA